MTHPHTLVLMRHARSSWSVDGPDAERPLCRRGRRDAVLAGQWLTERGLSPDQVLCSPTVRTRQTLERLRLDEVPTTFEPDLVDADGAGLGELVGRRADGATVLVIGHNPAIQQAVLRLGAQRGDQEWWRAITKKFPTSAIAALEVDDWAELDEDSARLRFYGVPRA